MTQPGDAVLDGVEVGPDRGGDRRRAGGPDLLRPGGVDRVRSGPAGEGAGVCRPDRARTAARAGRVRELGRSGHPGHPRCQHHERERALGSSRRRDRRCHDGADDRGDGTQLLAAHTAVAVDAAGALGRGPPLSPARADGLHHRGWNVLADQHHADGDGGGRPNGRGARARRRPGGRRRRRHRGVEPGRALHDEPAQHLVQRVRLLLRHPDRDGAGARRRRLCQRAGHPRPDHGCDALHPTAGRAAEPADRDRGPTPGRGGLHLTAAGDRGGAGRSDHGHCPARRDRAGRFGPAVLLPGRPRRPARDRRRPGAG